MRKAGKGLLLVLLVLLWGGFATAHATETGYGEYRLQAGTLAQGEGEYLLADEDVTLAEGETHTFTVVIPKAGLYALQITYTLPAGRSAPGEYALLIDGELPFSQAAALTLPRLWKDTQAEISVDENGNDLRPAQVEASIP